MISDHYRYLNALMHAKGKFDGPDALQHVEAILKWSLELGASTVLDYGCGCAVLSTALPLHVANYDPAVEAYNADPSAADILVSIDVLEHVEPEMLSEVLDHMRAKASFGAYLHISLVPDGVKLLPDGRNPHLLVKPAKWWVEQIGALFEIVRAEVSYKHEREYSLTLWCRK